jgi:hypothetical protein
MPASWFPVGIAMLPYEGVSDDTETSYEEGTEIVIRCSV